MNRRHSPAVYRRRRIVVFTGLLLVLAGIGFGVWALITQPWAETEQPDPAPTVPIVTPEPDPAETEDTEPDEEQSEQGEGEGEGAETSSSETAAPAEPVACTAADVTVEPVTDATHYRSGVNPQLSILLTNTSAHDCVMNVGSAAQVYTVRSGNDVWWRSTDCQVDPSDLEVLLAAGQQVSNEVPVEWNRTRSRPELCGDEQRQNAPGGGAAYRLSVEIGGVASQGTKQFFLY